MSNIGIIQTMPKEHQQIILVDKQDNQIGTGEKLKAHQQGNLHRAFSVFIFNSKGELLLQKRAATKYHSPGLWSNTCCSHPRPGKDIQKEAEMRLKEEMGIACSLKEVFSFHYKAKLGALIENEIDHVFIGRSDTTPKLNPEEAEGFMWIKRKELEGAISKHPEQYTPWLRRIFKKVYEYA